MSYIQLEKTSDFEPQSGMEYCKIYRMLLKPNNPQETFLQKFKKFLNVEQDQVRDPLRAGTGWNSHGIWQAVIIRYFDSDHTGDQDMNTKVSNKEHDQMLQTILAQDYQLVAIHESTVGETLFLGRLHQNNPKNIPVAKTKPAKKSTSDGSSDKEEGWDYCTIRAERSFGRDPWVWSVVDIYYSDIDGTYDHKNLSMTQDEFFDYSKKLKDEGWITAKPGSEWREHVARYYKRRK